MELRDLVVTPIVIMLVLMGAYLVRPYVTDSINRRYFFPALFVKIVGAIAVGLIYQFYYGGGDTFNFHTHGSRHIWEAFMDAPINGFRLLINDKNAADIYQHSSRILFYNDPPSYFVIRIAAIFDLLTFSSYSATAVLFAVFGFIGSWMFFLTFYLQYPHRHFQLAIASFFIPSVFFWGSGLLKDAITLACLGIATFQIYQLFIIKKTNLTSFILLAIAIVVIFSIKKFILQAYLPAAIIWVMASNLYNIRSVMLRLLVVPLSVLLVVFSAYYSVVKVGEGDKRYAIDKIAETARVTAYDIGFYTGRDAGSGYSLGDLDGSFLGLLSVAPAAVNVSLFRPYIWEVKNPLMLLSALEALVFLLFTLYIILKTPIGFLKCLKNPSVLFCFIFSLTFAFAVGVSTYNFGTLTRYKIPLLPFYLIALILVSDQLNNDKKLAELERTE